MSSSSYSSSRAYAHMQGSIGELGHLFYNYRYHQSFSTAVVLSLLWHLEAIPHRSLCLCRCYSLLVPRRCRRHNISMCARGRVLGQEHQECKMHEFVGFLYQHWSDQSPNGCHDSMPTHAYGLDTSYKQDTEDNLDRNFLTWVLVRTDILRQIYLALTRYKQCLCRLNRSHSLGFQSRRLRCNLGDF